LDSRLIVCTETENLFHGGDYAVEVSSGFADTFSTISFNTLHTSIICEYNALIALALEVHLVSE
jgi:hypothetical protein